MHIYIHCVYNMYIRPLLQQYDCLQCQIVCTHEAYGPTASSYNNSNSDGSSSNSSSRSPLTSRKGIASRLSLIKPSTGLVYTMYMKYGSECIGMMKAQKQPLNTTANYWISTNIGWVTKHKVWQLLLTMYVYIDRYICVQHFDKGCFAVHVLLVEELRSNK
jgi:hypothetical protein